MTAAPLLKPPGLGRRLACLLYEAALLFGVLMIGGIVYSVLAEQRHALEGKAGMQAFVFVLLGLYFTGFWSHGGQTLAMRTWHLRVVRLDGSPLSRTRAFARFLASWMWFLPALLALWATGLRSAAGAAGSIVLGMAAYASLAWLRRDRRLWHDVLCGTQMIDWRPAPPVPAGRAGASQEAAS